jgi:hypothetical protein
VSASPSAVAAVFDALQDAVSHTRAQLFPFRLNRWLPLGVAAFLDQCGRQGGAGFPNFSYRHNTGVMHPFDVGRAGAWLGQHVLLITLVAAGFFAVMVAMIAVVTWLRSRGTFMYIDNVAGGTFEIERPWRQHREIASSWFAWQLTIGLASFAAVVAMLVPIGILVYRFVAVRQPMILLGLVVPVLALLAMSLVCGAFAVASRDFVAPLQFQAQRSFGAALQVFWGLLRREPLAFFLYLLLKMVYATVAAVLTILACCLTCCLAALPVVNQAALQPVYYCERSWSLFLLRRLGYDVFPTPGGLRT